MTERDAFELRFAAAVRDHIGRVRSDLDPGELAHRIAAGSPRRHWFAPALVLRSVTVPSRVWVLLILAALLTGLVAAMLVVGSRPPELPAVVQPIGPQFACPAGTNPGEPGPAGQARPVWGQANVPEMAFDSKHGKLVAIADDGTWTFDVCTNTWAQLHPSIQPPGANSLVYDVDSALTVASDNARRMWAYDLEANTWTEKGRAPFDTWVFGDIRLWFYQPSSGLVVALEDDRLDDTLGSAPWGYDVEADRWTQLRKGTPVVIGSHYEFFAYERSADRVDAYVSVWGSAGRLGDWLFDARMWLYDVRTGTWSRTGALAPPVFNAGWWGFSPGIGYDEAAEQTVMLGQGYLATYDATADRWETLFEAPSEGAPATCGTRPECRQMPSMVYDPVNERLIVYGGHTSTVGGEVWPDGLMAFDTQTGDWTVLLEPSEGSLAPRPM